MTTEEFFPKENKYQERISNKKYLAKRKRYHDKVSWWTEDKPMEPTAEQFVARLDSNEDEWRISEIRQSTSGKLVSCLHPVHHEIRDISMTRNDPIIESIVIGDYVSLNEARIQGILERINLLARYKGDNDRFSLHKRALQPIAANLDYVVIVASAKDPKFQPWFIDRYMILAESAWISPIICITKSDLNPIDDPILHWYEKELHIPVIHTSSLNGMGMEDLKSQIKWRTVVFVGKSGVGKSSLTNYLLGEDIITTSHVSEKWWQGRHTTTGSKMHTWDGDSYIIDTPGIRSLEFLEFQREELKLYFPEFEEYSKNCRFRDCNHDTEPDCWIKDAVESNEIPQFRYNTYLRLLSDIL